MHFRNDFDVAVVCGGHGELVTRLQEQNIRTIPMSTMGRNIKIWREWQTLKELIKLFRNEKPDIIHLNSSKAGGLGAFAGRITKVPNIIFTAHGWASDEWQRPLIARAILKFFHWLTILLSKHTIAVAEVTKNKLINWPFVSNRIVTIYNGMSEPQFLPRNEAREYFANLINHDLQNKTLVGTIGELHKNKGFDFLIRAFALQPLRDGIITIIGEGEERKNLERLIHESHLDNKIFLVGAIPEARRLIKAFDLFVIPSRTEAFPYVLLEAGLAERTVVANRVGGIPELVEDNTTGKLIKRGHIKQLSDVIYDLILHPDSHDNFGPNLRHKIIEKCSPEKMFEKTLAVYNS